MWSFLKFGLFQNLSDFLIQKKLEEMYTCKNRFCPFVLGEDLGSYLCKAIKFLTQYVKKKILDIFLTLTVQNPKLEDTRLIISHMNKSFQKNVTKFKI